jgi:hypothetical protein
LRTSLAQAQIERSEMAFTKGSAAAVYRWGARRKRYREFETSMIAARQASDDPVFT